MCPNQVPVRQASELGAGTGKDGNPDKADQTQLLERCGILPGIPLWPTEGLGNTLGDPEGLQMMKFRLLGGRF